MPIYEYRCGVCGHALESFQKITEKPLLDCPKCQKPALQKLVSASGFQLKGTGWYATDFRNKGGKEASAASSEGKKEKEDVSGASAQGTSDNKTVNSTQSNSNQSNSNQSNSNQSNSTPNDKTEAK